MYKYEKITQENLDNFMDRVEKLTGEKWCPYPWDWFVDVCNKVDDKLFVQLINKRRTYRAPSMMCGQEPMLELLEQIVTNGYSLNVA